MGYFGDSQLKAQSKEGKISFLLKRNITLWDIWGYCYKNTPNSADDNNILGEPESEFADLSAILKNAKINKIFTMIGGSQNSTNPRGDNFKKWGINMQGIFRIVRIRVRLSIRYFLPRNRQD